MNIIGDRIIGSDQTITLTLWYQSKYIINGSSDIPLESEVSFELVFHDIYSHGKQWSYRLSNEDIIPPVGESNTWLLTFPGSKQKFIGDYSLVVTLVNPSVKPNDDNLDYINFGKQVIAFHNVLHLKGLCE